MPHVETTVTAEALDPVRLRAQLDELCSFERETATKGELRAAEWLAARLSEVGLEPRLESERIHSTYWWPLGIASAAGALAGIAGRRGHRLLGAALGAVAAAAAADDMPGDGRRVLRSLLPAGPRRSWSPRSAPPTPSGQSS